MRNLTNLKIWWAISVFLLVVAVCTSSVFATGSYDGGDGLTAPTAFQINTPAQMDEIGQHSEDWGSYFILTADIDLSGYTDTAFNIIAPDTDTGTGGHQGTKFIGSFDGKGHTISNFSYSSTGTNYIGLFGYVGTGGEVKNLILADPNVNAGTGDYVGGLVGYNYYGTVSNCHAAGSVSGTNRVGGLEGHNYHGTVSNCYPTGNVVGEDWAGGLVGWNLEGTVSNCYAAGNVSGEDHVGGLVGKNEGTVSNCYAYAAGNVTGHNYVGGLVGQNWGGTVSNCYATDSVSGSWGVGGLVGDNRGGTVSNCYAAGIVTGDYFVGGLVGYNGGWVLSSFWDTETSGQSTSSGGTGKTTTEMQTESTFTDYGWDFAGETANGTEDIWIMCQVGQYPSFWWQCNTPPVADAGPDQTAYAWIDGIAEVQLDGSDSNDVDGDELTYLWTWTIDANEMTATGVDPNIQLPVGEHTIELIVNDGREDSEPDYVVISVIAPVEADVYIVPSVINRNNHLKRVMAIMRLPEGIEKGDVVRESFELYAGGLDAEPVGAIWERVIGWGDMTRVFALFDKDELMDVVPNNGRVELTVVGRLESGQYIQGWDTVRIVKPRRRRPHWQAGRRGRLKLR